MLWQDASEVVAGLCLKQRLNPETINPLHLYPPYDLIVSGMVKGQDTTDIIEKVGLAPVQACISASEMVDHKLPADWVAILESSSSRADAASTFKRAAERLSTGDDPDYGRIAEALEKLQKNDGTTFITLDRVDASEAVWRRTYYPPLDQHLGNSRTCGIPDAGLTIIGAPPGCLTGDTEVTVNRAGKSFRISMEQLEIMFNGGKNGGRIWDKNIPTTSRSMFDGGSIGLNLVEAVTYSGEMECYTLTTEEGHTLTGTIDHPIYTPDGKVWLSELQAGDKIYVDGGQKKNGSKRKSSYLSKEGLKFHKYTGRVKSHRYAVPLHRLIVESVMNDLELEEFVTRCRTGDRCNELDFLEPEFAVHHKDGDAHNNNIDNLEVMTHKEHWTLHSKEGQKNVNYAVTVATVSSVIPVGIRKTYDISMKNDPHNFIANGIVVSNTGKTSLLVKIFGCAAKAGKKVCLISLEMTNGQIVNRFIETSDLTMEERRNIISAEDSLTLDELYSKVSRLTALEDIYMIGVDFADLLLDSADDEASVAHVYRTMAKLAKRTGVPVILLSQLNREYVGGIPRIHNIRYSGLAEAMAGLILMLYNPGQTWSKVGTDERLPLSKGKGYIIVGKSRFGYSGPKGNEYEQTGTGAIQVEWDGLTAWGESSYGWFPLS